MPRPDRFGSNPVIIKVSTCFPVFPQSGRLAPVVVSPTHIAIQIHEFEAERLKVVRADSPAAAGRFGAA
jgi:hypothetical protein